MNFISNTRSLCEDWESVEVLPETQKPTQRFKGKKQKTMFQTKDQDKTTENTF